MVPTEKSRSSEAGGGNGGLSSWSLMLLALMAGLGMERLWAASNPRYMRSQVPVKSEGDSNKEGDGRNLNTRGSFV